jgi:hypothetical protein
MCREGFETEDERGKKEMATSAKPDIFLPYVLPNNGGDPVRIKTPSWKLEFDFRMTLYPYSE